MNIVLEDIEKDDIIRMFDFIHDYPWREGIMPEDGVDVLSLLRYILQTLEDTEDYSDEQQAHNQMELSF